MYRIGFGYDVHRLSRGRSLILGGVKVPHEFGLLGHSDADVLTHAIMDALLGALAAGDIGGRFPDNDPQYKDADSLRLLEKVMSTVRKAGFRVNNLDATVVAESPRLSPYIGKMRAVLSEAVGTETDRVSVKATTSEGLGFCGRGEGIAAYAVASLVSVGERESSGDPNGR